MTPPNAGPTAAPSARRLYGAVAATHEARP